MSTALAKRVSVRTEEARVLEARERRQKARQELARSVPGRSLLELCLEIPPGSTPTEEAERTFLSGMKCLETELGLEPSEMEGDALGYYSLFITEWPALLARRRASRIEEQASWDSHLGIECYGMAGSMVTTGPVPRATVGANTPR